jgi:hypothetical protein
MDAKPHFMNNKFINYQELKDQLIQLITESERAIYWFSISHAVLPVDIKNQFIIRSKKRIALARQLLKFL